MKLYFHTLLPPPPKRPRRCTALIGRCWMPQLRPSSRNIGRKKRELVATEGRPTIIIHCKMRDRETLFGLLVFAKNSAIGSLSSPASAGVRSVSLGLQKSRAPRGHTTCSDFLQLPASLEEVRGEAGRGCCEEATGTSSCPTTEGRRAPAEGG